MKLNQKAVFAYIAMFLKKMFRKALVIQNFVALSAEPKKQSNETEEFVRDACSVEKCRVPGQCILKNKPDAKKQAFQTPTLPDIRSACQETPSQNVHFGRKFWFFC
jgi:hypothetical protein